MPGRKGHKTSAGAKIVFAVACFVSLWLVVELDLHNALAELMVLPLAQHHCS